MRWTLRLSIALVIVALVAATAAAWAMVRLRPGETRRPIRPGPSGAATAAVASGRGARAGGSGR